MAFWCFQINASVSAHTEHRTLELLNRKTIEICFSFYCRYFFSFSKIDWIFSSCLSRHRLTFTLTSLRLFTREKIASFSTELLLFVFFRSSFPSVSSSSSAKDVWTMNLEWECLNMISWFGIFRSGTRYTDRKVWLNILFMKRSR